MIEGENWPSRECVESIPDLARSLCRFLRANLRLSNEPADVPFKSPSIVEVGVARELDRLSYPIYGRSVAQYENDVAEASRRGWPWAIQNWILAMPDIKGLELDFLFAPEQNTTGATAIQRGGHLLHNPTLHWGNEVTGYLNSLFEIVATLRIYFHKGPVFSREHWIAAGEWLWEEVSTPGVWGDGGPPSREPWFTKLFCRAPEYGRSLPDEFCAPISQGKPAPVPPEISKHGTKKNPLTDGFPVEWLDRMESLADSLEASIQIKIPHSLPKPQETPPFPVQVLVGAFSNAIGVIEELRAFATQHGFVGTPSYRVISEGLGFVNTNIRALKRLREAIPEAILDDLDEVESIVGDACASISHADVCEALLKSDLEAIAERGWRRTIRVRHGRPVDGTPRRETSSTIKHAVDGLDRYKATLAHHALMSLTSALLNPLVTFEVRETGGGIGEDSDRELSAYRGRVEAAADAAEQAVKDLVRRVDRSAPLGQIVVAVQAALDAVIGRVVPDLVAHAKEDALRRVAQRIVERDYGGRRETAPLHVSCAATRVTDSDRRIVTLREATSKLGSWTLGGAEAETELQSDTPPETAAVKSSSPAKKPRAKPGPKIDDETDKAFYEAVQAYREACKPKRAFKPGFWDWMLESSFDCGDATDTDDAYRRHKNYADRNKSSEAA